MRRLLREPLLHFIVLGGLLFALYGWVQGGRPAPDEIVVDDARVTMLAARFHRSWLRPPTPEEMRGLIDGWVREEVLVREGLAQGLDRDDPVVRRRILQKVSFVAESLAEQSPGDDELQAWLDAHAADYATEPLYTLRQVFFDPLKQGSRLDAALASARVALERNPDARVGDATLLPAGAQDASTGELVRVFGEDFVRSLRDLPQGSWQGPVRSGYGVHLVRIDARQESRAPKLAEARTQVERDFGNHRRQQAEERFYQALLRRYVVKVEVAAISGAPGSDDRPAITR